MDNTPATTIDRIAAISPEALGKVRRLEDHLLTLPQVDLDTTHVLHAGMYARTIRVPAGVVFTGALIKVASTLIISGDVVVTLGAKSSRLSGYHVLSCSAGRKQAFVTMGETFITMIFPTTADTVEQAEKEATDEAGALASHRNSAKNTIIITEERPCRMQQ